MRSFSPLASQYIIFKMGTIFFILVVIISLISEAISLNIERRLFNSSVLYSKANSFLVLVKGKKFTCGGVLYTEDIVITARHCISEPENDYVIYTKQSDKYNIFHSPISRTHSVLEIVYHPGFISLKDPHYDLAILKLNTPKSDTRLVDLDNLDRANIVGTTINIYSCLKHYYINEKEHLLIELPRESKMNVLDPEDCFNINHVGGIIKVKDDQIIDLYENHTAYKHYNFMSEVEFCAGNFTHPKNLVGSGDSGSPAIIYNRDTGRPVLTGIVSWRKPVINCSSGFTTFVRVSMLRSWIDNTVHELHQRHRSREQFHNPIVTSSK